MMQVISLFSGIGGFELAARWMGWDNIVSCEINEFGRKVLQYHFPESYHHSDIKTLNYETIKEKSRYQEDKTTILVGGFPCQPFSVAGKQKGTNDNRHLWPEMLRIIREIKPKFIVAENVRGILNIEGGMVFENVCTSLENEGYKVQSFIIPACSVNAPHRRDRIWFIAYSDSTTTNIRQRSGSGQKREQTSTKRAMVSQRNGESSSKINKKDCGTWAAGVGSSPKLQGCKLSGSTKGTRKIQKESRQFSGSIRSEWQNFPTESPICGPNDGLPGKLDGITFSKWRRESLKAYGNAIVPQVAFEIFKAIERTFLK